MRDIDSTGQYFLILISKWNCKLGDMYNGPFNSYMISSRGQQTEHERIRMIINYLALIKIINLHLFLLFCK